MFMYLPFGLWLQNTRSPGCSDSFAKMGFSQKQFDTENEELVDVEDEEEDEDDSEFFDESSDDVLDEE